MGLVEVSMAVVEDVFHVYVCADMDCRSVDPHINLRET